VNSELSANGTLAASSTAAMVPPTDPEALNQLFSTWMPRLCRAASRMLHNQEDSEDAAQDTLLSAFENLDQFEGRAKFTTWMYSILLNTVRARLRKQRSTPEMYPIDADSPDEETRSYAVELMDLGPDPEQECAREEGGRILAESFQKLPVIYQSVIQLCDVEELEQKEAAERLGLPLGTVKCQLHRARRMFSERARKARAFPVHLDPDHAAKGSRAAGATSPAVS